MFFFLDVQHPCQVPGVNWWDATLEGDQLAGAQGMRE